MSNNFLYLDNFTESLAGISQYNELQFSSSSEYQKMLKVLLKAIDGELTNRQRECVVMYYGKNMRITDIANELDVCMSTVSRHLSKARNRLRKVIGYYFARLEN